MKCQFAAVWYVGGFEDRFVFTEASGQSGETDGADVIASFIGHDKDSIMAKTRLDFANAMAEGNEGFYAGENDVVATLEDGFVEIENDYLDDFIVHMDPAEFLRLLDWRIAIMQSDDYKNPDAVFESIEIEYKAIPPIEGSGRTITGGFDEL